MLYELSNLLENGIAHIYVPNELLISFTGLNSLSADWLSKVNDGETLLSDSNELHTEFQTSINKLSIFVDNQIKKYLNWDNIKPARVRKIEWEQNFFHYDIKEGLTTSETYENKDAISEIQRKEWIKNNPVHFLCTLPFPVDLQLPTVCYPWNSDVPVEGFSNNITIFALNLIYHRGNRVFENPRGVWLKPVEQTISIDKV